MCPSATGDCTLDPLTCTAAFFGWADKYHLWLGNKGETTDGSSGPGARIFTGEPDPAGDGHDDGHPCHGADLDPRTPPPG